MLLLGLNIKKTSRFAEIYFWSFWKMYSVTFLLLLNKFVVKVVSINADSENFKEILPI